MTASANALDALAAFRPRTLDELEGIEGIGPKKLEQYGEEILAITAEDDA